MEQVTSIEQLVIKQGVIIDALKFFIEYSSDMDRVIGHIDYTIGAYGENSVLESHRAELIKVWEKQNEPHKWPVEVFGEEE